MSEVENMTVDEVGNDRDYVEFTQNLTRGIDAAQELQHLLGRLSHETKGQLEIMKVNKRVVPVESADFCAELDKTVADVQAQLAQVAELVKRSARRKAFLVSEWAAYLDGTVVPYLGSEYATLKNRSE